MTEVLTPNEVAEMLKLPSRKSLYSHVDAGRIPGVIRIGRLLRFRADAVRALIAGDDQIENRSDDRESTSANK